MTAARIRSRRRHRIPAAYRARPGRSEASGRDDVGGRSFPWRSLTAGRRRGRCSGERRDVVRIDGREHGDPQLVAPELPVRLGVDHAVGPQHLGHGGRVDGRRRSRWCRRHCCARPVWPRTGWRRPVDSAQPYRIAGRALRPPGREVDTAAGQHPVQLVHEAGRWWPGPGCCRSGRAGSAPRRCSGRGRPASSGRTRGCGPPARGPPARAPPPTGRRRRRSPSGGRSSRRPPPAGRSAGRPRRTWRRRRPGPRRLPSGRRSVHHHPGGGLVVRQGVEVDLRVGAAARGGCRRADSMTCGRVQVGSGGRGLGELG